MGTYNPDTDTVWSTTHTGYIAHAFDSEGRALCNRSIRPRSHTTSHNDWGTRTNYENLTHTTVHARCVQKLDATAQAPAEQTAPTAPAAARAGEVTIPGALADFLADTQLATGDDDHDPVSKATREALDAGRRGRGRTLIIRPKSTDVLNVISEYAGTLLTTDEATTAERKAAQKWIEQAGPARKQLTAERAAEERAERRQRLADSRGATAYPLAVAAVRLVVREMPQVVLCVRVVEGSPEASLAREDLHALAYSGHTTADAVARVRAAVAAHIRHGDRELHVMFPAWGMRPALYLADVMALLRRWDDEQALASEQAHTEVEPTDVVAPEITHASVDAYLAREYPALFAHRPSTD